MPVAELKSNGWAYVWKTCSLQGSQSLAWHGGNLKTSEIVETGQLEGCHDLYAAVHLGVRIGKRAPSVMRIVTILIIEYVTTLCKTSNRCDFRSAQ